MDCPLGQKKNGCCREVAISGVSTSCIYLTKEMDNL